MTKCLKINKDYLKTVESFKFDQILLFYSNLICRWIKKIIIIIKKSMIAQAIEVTLKKDILHIYL